MENGYPTPPPRFDPETGRPLYQPGFTPPHGELKTVTPIAPFLITLFAAILFAMAFFMPYATVTEEYEDYYIGGYYYSDVDMDGDDLKNVSLMDFASIYSEIGDEYIVYTMFISFLALFAFLSLLFAILKKPIPIIVFSVISLFIFFVLSFAFSERSIVPSARYDRGFGYFIMIVSIIISFVGSIIMVSTRKKKYV